MFSKFSVKKPLTIFVGVIMVILLGFISFTSMKTDLLPKLDLPYVMISTTYPGASPEKIEQIVTKPLEKVIATTSGIKNINSVSSENSSMLFMEFEQTSNMDSVMIELSSKIDMVKPMMPDEVGEPMVLKANPDMMPIVVASVDIKGLDKKETSKKVKNNVIPALERIDGVAAVEAMGLLEENIKITLDDKKINDLDNKVLSSIDSKLASAKKEIEGGISSVKSGKESLNSEGKKKTEELANASSALDEGESKLQEAKNSLTLGESELTKQKIELTKQIEALEAVIKKQEENNIPVLEEQKKALLDMKNGIVEIDKNLSEIKQKKPLIESQLNDLKGKKAQLESGKLTLNQELSKASANLSVTEGQLNSALKEFEAQRDAAYKSANIKDMLNKEAISGILKAQNFSMPAGYIKEGEKDYLVKVGEDIKNLDELKNLVLFNIDVKGVGDVKLSDVAKIEISNNSDEMYAKINGNDGILLSIQKQSTASTTEVSDKVNNEIEKLTKENKGMNIIPLNDQGVYINIVIESVISNLILGGILSIIILLVFLRSIKPTIIISFSIPISVMFAITMMYFSGVTINIISLSGLALGVGMLVDNSIVVIENIYRLRSEGLSAAKAAVKGANEVAGAITSSTLTTICVFLPIVFTKGISRQLFTDMGLTIAYSLLASLIVALTLVPSMSSILIKKEIKSNKVFGDKVFNFYDKVLDFSLKHKIIVIALSAFMLIASTTLCVLKGAILMPETDATAITATLKSPKEATKSEVREMSNKLIDVITTVEGVETVGALQTSGGEMMMGPIGGSGNDVSMYILLKENRNLTSKQIGKIISEKVKPLGYDLEVGTSSMDMSALGGSGIEIKIKGNSLEKLKSIGNDIAGIVKSVEGTYEVSNGVDKSSVETRIVVDKNKAALYGLTVAQVYNGVSEAIKQQVDSTTININDKEYPVIIVKDEKSNLKKDKISSYKIKGKKNNEEVNVALSEIAKITEGESLQGINHENQSRTLSVKALVDDKHNIALVSNEVEKKVKEYKVAEGYKVEIGGEKEAMQSAFIDLIKMITLAIVFIYLIMVAQFQSLMSPFIVLFTIPLAFTGGFLSLLITGFELSMISILGFLMLSGIVVNNGIVFVDYVNQLRYEGISKKEALFIAGKVRMRPIFMTALTTVLGLSTMAMGIGQGSEMIQPMAIVTIGGLLYATILTLVVVPVMYDILNRKEMKKIEIED